MSAISADTTTIAATSETAFSLFVGLATFDLAQQVAALPKSNRKSVANAQFVAAGGPATNAAVTCARLLAGTHPLLFTTGEDLSEQIRKLWSPEPGCAVVPGCETILVSAVGDGPLAAAMKTDIAQQGVILHDCTARSLATPPPTQSQHMSASRSGESSTSNQFLPALAAPGELVNSPTSNAHDPAHATRPWLQTGMEATPLTADRPVQHQPAPAQAALTPPVSTIFVEPNGDRAISSMNAKLPVDARILTRVLHQLQARSLRVLLVDGYYPALALPALQWAQAHAPKAPRILDGGSWKEHLPSLLPLIDIAVLSADFLPPTATDFTSTCAVLGEYGVKHVIQTNGSDPVRYCWDGKEGSVAVPPAPRVIDTLGAGDIFHGAFAAAFAKAHTPWQVQDIADIEQSVHAAAAIAAASVSYFGTRF